MVLDMRLSFAGRWRGEARGASGCGRRVAGAARSLREAPDGVNERAASARVSRNSSAVAVLQLADRPHIGNKVIRPSYDRRALDPSRLSLEKE